MTTLRLLNLELNTNAYIRVNIFYNLYITTLFRRIGTNITNNNDVSFFDSTLTKEGYTILLMLGSVLDPDPYLSESHFSVARLMDLVG